MIENKIKENLLNKIIKKIQEEQFNIKKANQVDQKYYNMQIKIEKLLEISEELKKQDLKERSQQDIVVIHNGNPYITYILAIKAVVNEINIKIGINHTMLGTNMVLIKIIEEITRQMKIKTNVEIKQDEEISDTNILVLGDKNQYRMLLRKNIKNIKYNAKTNISLYVENQELEELKQNIIKYCEDNLIEIEIYEAENVRDALHQIKADNEGERIMILTKEKIDKDDMKEMPIAINQNILKDFEKELVKEKIL